MSIILEALRKAEAKRNGDGRPSLTRPPSRAPRAQRLPRWGIPAAAAVLIGAGAAAAYLLLSRDAPAPAPVAGAATPAVERAPAAPVASRPPSAAPGLPEATPAPGGQVRVLALEARLATPPPAAPPPPESARVEVRDLTAATTEGSAAGTRTRPGSVEVRDLLAEEGLAEPVPEAGPGPASGAARGEEQALANKERGLLAEPPAGSARTAARPPAPATPSLDELVANGQLNPPEISLDMHAYADDPAVRFVYINMRRYRIGDTTREGAVVEDITDEGVVLQLQGRRFLISAR
jgi:general secretion pathway protein B